MTDSERMILVTGATGNIGQHVVAGLLDRGAAVRTMSRHPVPAATSLPRGVEVVGGDLTDADSLAAALSGVDAVFLLWPFLSPDGADAVAAVLAKHARRVVLVSALNVHDDRDPTENGVWGQVEHAIRQTGIGWTFLRASGFATNTLEWVPAIRAGEDVRIPYAHAARSLIHERDIADVAVRALSEDGHEGAAYVLTGPAVVTQTEQVRIIGEAAGRQARLVEISPDEARAQLTARYGDPAFVDTALAYWGGLVDAPEPVTRTVEEITGKPARPFAEWAREHAEDFRAFSPAELAERYVSAFRAGRMDRAMRLMAADLVRVAPLESGGERVEVRGLGAIMANSQRLNADFDIHGVEVDGPFLDMDGDRFAVGFSFDETHLPTGRRTTTTKLSLYTIAGATITREEVFYFDRPPGVVTNLPQARALTDPRE
jgi:uncharacterized protein YbjT (DUF2867 family)